MTINIENNDQIELIYLYKDVLAIETSDSHVYRVINKVIIFVHRFIISKYVEPNSL
jgi:hypothetical protein